MRAIFTAIRWFATFTKRSRLKHNPTTWADMTDTWSSYSDVTWTELTE